MLDHPLALLTGIVIGLVLLTVAADRFVVGAARLSLSLRLPPVVVGAVVIGFGTSLPEFLVSALGSAQNATGVAYGNVVGSNTANMLLVLGAAAVVSPVTTTVTTLRREVPMMLVGVVLLAGLAADGFVGRPEGAALLAVGIAALGLLTWFAVADRGSGRFAADVTETAGGTGGTEHGAGPPGGRSTPRTWRGHRARAAWMTVVGLLGTLAGAHLLVISASGLARAVGIAEAVVGLTVVAIGTSLPELVTAVAAARRRQADLVVGNVLGSNLFNALPVAGVAALISPARFEPTFGWALAIMVVACLVAGGFLATGRRINRVEGVGLLTGFVAAITAVVWWG
ncbi:calcium/sodium antiporter [Egibacter rhizosphaerae]|uniref:calcium/sodium antiporter n=1 Tax=Egibacter rhizosphaerae TaxID=1670831 RepID=UPI0013F15A88|nr:calcium/sodium antiporter [Egibacter rhizosphaerae]